MDIIIEHYKFFRNTIFLIIYIIGQIDLKQLIIVLRSIFSKAILVLLTAAEYESDNSGINCFCSDHIESEIRFIGPFTLMSNGCNVAVCDSGILINSIFNCSALSFTSSVKCAPNESNNNAHGFFFV